MESESPSYMYFINCANWGCSQSISNQYTYIFCRTSTLSEINKLVEKEKALCDEALSHTDILISLFMKNASDDQTPTVRISDFSDTEATDFIKHLVEGM